MTYQELKAKHNKFIYQSFNATLEDSQLQIVFHFHIEPDLDFKPIITIPFKGKPDVENLHSLLFNLGMVEAISYWKSTCSPIFEVAAGALSQNQIDWWQDLFLHGLGEFYFVNQIDFTEPDFLQIYSTSNAPPHHIAQKKSTNGDLIMVGGGKDSVVTLEALSELKTNKNVMLLNPTIAATKTSKQAGFNSPITIKRTIDPALLKLNSEGYLNGHTPFSAYLSFAGILAAYLNDFQQLIASNESSAGESSLSYQDLEVNHQYSKSYRYENKFIAYADTYLTGDCHYFSFLRPIDELTIANLFSLNTAYDQSFSSCNTTRNDGWCGTCPKCAFVFLMMSAVLKHDRIQRIFGQQDLFENPQIKQHLSDLVGHTNHKPLDCVGTEKESQQAIHQTIQNLRSQALEIPSILSELVNHIPPLDPNSITTWTQEHHLPPAYEMMLKSQLEKANL